MVKLVKFVILVVEELEVGDDINNDDDDVILLGLEEWLQEDQVLLFLMKKLN